MEIMKIEGIESIKPTEKITMLWLRAFFIADMVNGYVRVTEDVPIGNRYLLHEQKLKIREIPK